MGFKELGLREELVKAVEGLGFDAPMPIQEQAIPALLLNERDFVGLAQTGTGKTCAFGLPLIQSIDPAIPGPQGIIICPTRELCRQITEDLEKFSINMKKIGMAPVYGGADMGNQIKRIKKGARIIIATPGRLLDLINRRALKLSQVSHVILDEADEMLKMGFQEDIDAILSNIPDERRIWLFSATMPSGVAAIARNYLTDPLEVTVGGKNSSPKNIRHTCFTIREQDRYEALKRVLDFSPDIFGLVFCRTRSETRDVAAGLNRDGYDADAIHGDLSQAQRDFVMQKFRNGSLRLLVATDVAARGLDVDDLTHVIHYKLPDEIRGYTHRSGRTARAGKHGASIALINVKEKYRIKAIENQCKIRFDFGKLPAGPEICQKQLLNRIGKILDTKVNDADIREYMPAVYEALNGMDKEDLIKRFVSSEFNGIIEHYRDARDINVQSGKTRGLKAPNFKTGVKKTHVRQRTTKHESPGLVPSKKRVNERNSKTGVKKNMKRWKDGKDEKGGKGWKGGKVWKGEKYGKGGKTQRFFINIGKLDKINEGAIVRLICDHSGIRSNMIGQIDLKREFSFFNVEQRAAGKVLESVRNAKLDGRAVMVREVFE